MSTRQALERLSWLDLGLGIAVGLIGIWQGPAGSGTAALIALAMALAAGTYRVVPSVALGLVWASSALQLASGFDVLPVQVATILVAYGTARHGSPITLWLSGLSIPTGSVVVMLYVESHGAARLVGLGRDLLPASVTSVTTAFLLVLVLLSAPWALGLVLRLRAQFSQARVARERAEIEATRAQEVAELRAEQTRLARDVHDVVGHSLTVILAQADSVEFMDDADIGQIRAALRNIATSARRSLGDVREVLSSTNDQTTSQARTAGGLDSLLDGVVAAGNDIRSTVEGIPRPLPPELDVVAFRVLQEMLTNALKHGRRGEPITVERSWGNDDLRIMVHNVMADAAGGDPAAGSASVTVEGIGQLGMRRRLESVGGRLEVAQQHTGQGRTFSATAWVPLRPRVEA